MRLSNPGCVTASYGIAGTSLSVTFGIFWRQDGLPERPRHHSRFSRLAPMDVVVFSAAGAVGILGGVTVVFAVAGAVGVVVGVVFAVAAVVVVVCCCWCVLGVVVGAVFVVVVL